MKKIDYYLLEKRIRELESNLQASEITHYIYLLVVTIFFLIALFYTRCK